MVGAGIAGASAAYFLARAGAQVTVLDAGEATASHVPAALLNPVRGQGGQVDARALAGLHATWALIAELEEAGHPVPHARSGVLRPLPDERSREQFARRLAALPAPGLAHEWRPAALPGWPEALWLPEGGWVDGGALTRALLRASGAELRRERLPGPTHPDFAPARTLFCGGSVGVHWAGETATHRQGTLLRLSRAPHSYPLSFGAYLSPAAQGGVLGATFEAPAPTWRPPALPPASLAWLLDKAGALTDLRGLQVTGQWTGTRLSGLRAGQEPGGRWRLTGLGSKGFLLGPLLAHEVAQAMQEARTGGPDGVQGHSSGLT